MRTFTVTLQDSQGSDRFESVSQLIAADASGSFGLLAGHEHMVSVLRYGLVRFINSEGKWRYASLPGGVLRFADDQLTVATVRYFLGDDRDKIVAQLEAEMARTDSDINTARTTLAEIEHSLVKRLGELSSKETW